MEETNPLGQHASSSVLDGSTRPAQFPMNGYRCVALCVQKNEQRRGVRTEHTREERLAATVLNACQTQNKRLIQSAAYCWKVENLRFITVL